MGHHYSQHRWKRPGIVEETVPGGRLLHRIATQSGALVLSNLRKSAVNGREGCYTALLHNRPVELCDWGTQFSYRRRVPHDAHNLTSRTEIWQSLRTDSLKIALRRLPSAMARVEAEIEHLRGVANLACDPTLLGPSSYDAVTKRPASPPAVPAGKAEVPVSPPASGLTFGKACE